jgi:hypothetical protein
MSCSLESERVDEQLVGTAPYAVAWLAVEQNGPWGAKAFTASHLDPEIGRALEQRASQHDVRPSLIRSPGRHADDHHVGAHRVLLAHSRPGATWLLEGNVEDPAQLLDLDWAALSSGDVTAFDGFDRTDRVHLLVCTNGTRDVCCATRGRPVAHAAAEGRPGQVWEATHTSGHRFAPTAVLLPFGTLHGRLTGETAIEALDAAMRGQHVLSTSRGRSAWAAEAQVAEHAVRLDTSELELDSLTVEGEAGRYVVRHRDGRSWLVRTERHDTGVTRSESCAKAPVPMHRVTATITRADR